MGEDSMRQIYGTIFAVGAAVVLLVFVILRNRRNKELKRLPPGPKPWPIIGNLGEMDQLSHQGFLNMSRKYGSPVIHLSLGSVHLIVANSIDTAKQMLKVQDLNWASRPKITSFTEMSYNNQTISMSPHGPVWRHLRKVYVLELLTANRIKHFQSVRAEEIKEAVRTLLLESNGEKAVPIVPKVKEYMTNVLTRMIMSKSYFGKNASGKESQKFQESILKVLMLFGVFHVGDYIPLFKHWDVQGNKKKMKEAHAGFDEFLQNVLEERRQELADRRKTGDHKGSLEKGKGDFLEVLETRSVDNDDVEFTDDRIKAILQDSIIGGVDSTAASVEWALAEILRHPKVLEKLQDELDRTVGRERLVEEEDVSKMVYLQAVVKEIFRLHPVNPLLIPREAFKACEIGGYYVPAGTQAYVNVYAIGVDPKVWENPLDFNPERFLGNPIDVIGADFELLPFGSGRRKCPGINMGVLFLQYIVAVLIQSCEWSFPPGRTPETFDMSDGIGAVNHRRHPVEAVVTGRLPGHILAPAP